ncbi:MAG: hypothetical protein Kow00124_24020 [Anaerolineae bacterium]
MDDQAVLHRMAEQAATDPDLMASLIAQIRQAERLDADQAAARLGISRGQLDRLALCRRPGGAHFDEEVAQIAAYVGMPRESLAGLLAAARAEDTASAPAGPPSRSERSLEEKRPGEMYRTVLRWGLAAAGVLLVLGMMLAQPEKAQATLAVNEGQVTLVQTRAILFGLSTAHEMTVSRGEAIDVREGDRIALGQDAAAQLVLLDGSTVDLEAGAEVAVAELDLADDQYRVNLTVLAGRTYQRVQRVLGIDDTFTISTPSSAASVRGTEFAVEVLAPDSSYFACDDGQVAVSLDGSTAVLNAGEEVYAVVGEPLLPRPQGDGLTIISPTSPPAAGSTVDVRGYAPIGAAVRVAGQPVPVAANGYFEAQVTAGSEPIIVEATNGHDLIVRIEITTR